MILLVVSQTPALLPVLRCLHAQNILMKSCRAHEVLPFSHHTA